jgi:hypothetical protein
MKMISCMVLLGTTFFMLSGCASKPPEEPAKICEIGVEYEHTAVAPVRCVCPEGYSFQVVSMGWGPCPVEGMRDCPKSIQTCAKTETAP